MLPKRPYRYTSAQKEILCNLELPGDMNDKDKEWQNRLAGKLADHIENDVKGTLYNPEKVNRYRTQAGLAPIDEHPFLNTTHVQNFLSWFSSVRLFFVRLNGSLKLFGLGFLPKFIDVFGLSYAFDLVVDIVDIIVSTFIIPLRAAEQNLIDAKQASYAEIYWWRFKNKMTQDIELIPRMLNSIVWFGVNLALFILTGGIGNIALAPAIKIIVNDLNIGGFIFDVFNETYNGIRDYYEHAETLCRVEKELVDLSRKKNQCLLAKKAYEINNDTNNDKYKKIVGRCQKLDEKIHSRQTLKNKLEEKITWTLIPKRVFNWAVAAVIGVGMSMFACADKIIMMTGRLLAFIGGSVIGGFGRRVRNTLASLFCKNKEENPIALQSIPNSTAVNKYTEPANNDVNQQKQTATLSMMIPGSNRMIDKKLLAISCPPENKFHFSFTQDETTPLTGSYPAKQNPNKSANSSTVQLVMNKRTLSF